MSTASDETEPHSQIVPLKDQPLLRGRLRWLRRFVLGLLVLLTLFTLLALGTRAYVIHAADKRLEEVMTDLDRTDPGWRWEELQAAREVIPEEQNSAPLILKIAKLIPHDWPNRSAASLARSDAVSSMGAPTGLSDRLNDIEPVRQLDPKMLKELRSELNLLAPTLAEARKLINFPKGRYTVPWQKNLILTVVPHQDARRVAALLWVDAAMRAQDRDYEGAAESARAVLNTARSVGDEPLLIVQLVRIACGIRAVRSYERVLAQGQLSQDSLRLAGNLFEDEAAQPLILYGTRGERCANLALLESISNGESYPEHLFDASKFEPDWWDKAKAWLYVGPLFQWHRAPALELMTRFVEVAKLGPHERRKELASLGREVRELRNTRPALAGSVLLCFYGLSDCTEPQDRYCAHLRCGLVGMALERFRMARGKWPDRLEELVPAYISEVPDDPFIDFPLRYHQLQDGVVVYSVGPDGEDNDGVINRQNTREPGTDIGFRLWNPDRRRQPPAPSPPAD